MVSHNDQVRIVVLGFSDVGKSALTVRFLTRRFITEYANGIDSVYVHNAVVRGKSVEVKIIDHGVKNDPSDLIRWADGFILVYSIASRESLEEVKCLKKSIDAIKGGYNRTSCVIVGNKADLRRQRKVTTVEAKSVARDNGCGVFEVSAAEQIEPVFEIFKYTITNTLDHKERSAVEVARTMKGHHGPEGGKRIFGRRLGMRSKSRDRTKTL